jgi:signal transduction histidine kinase
VSTQQEPASGSALEDTTKVFRLPAPLVLWWVWVAFTVVNLADLAIQGHDRLSAQIAIGLLAITGVVYACAFRPRVRTDADGLTIVNPLREYRVPWARVRDVALGESVQVHCTAAAPATGKGKVLHSWALYSPRRSRLKAEVRGRRMDRNLVSRPGGYARMPVEAREAAKQHPAELMAREIQGIGQKARERGAPDGPVAASWAWSSLAAMLVPALLFALVIVIG